jgi:hypothetical protein
MPSIEDEQNRDYVKPAVNETGASEQILNSEEQRYFEELKYGKFLGILETYVSDEKWTLERVVRDAWQNFFDANGGTLDNINFSSKKENGEIIITIHGNAQYDFRRLLHFGAGSKIGSSTTAGKYGEGTRIYALHMLRDYGFQRVKFISGEWGLEFYLDRVPPHEVPEEMKNIRGLFAKLSFSKEEHPGSAVELITANEENVKAIQRARDLFYHSENPDFRHPDVDTDKGGLKIHFGQKGNLYINGQRIHFDSRDQWLTLPDMTVWSWETPRLGDRALKLGRERSLVTSKELQEIVLPFIVNSMSAEECQMLLPVLEPVYDAESLSAAESERLLSLLVARLAAEGYKGNFPGNFLAHDVSPATAALLKQVGYRLCRPYLGKVGMKKASVEFRDIEEVHSVEMNEAERARAELVQNAIKTFLEESKINLNIQARPIRAFIGEHPFLHGKYETDWVFINQFVLSSGDLAKLLALYMHEICHVAGPDESAEFTYAYTHLVEAWTRYIIERPGVLPALNEKFLAIKETTPGWESYDDFARFIDPLLEKERQDPSSPLRSFSESHEGRIGSAKFSLEEIIEDEFAGEYSAKNMITIYETALQNEVFKQVREIFDRPSDHMTLEEESAYESKLEKLNLRRGQLEKMMQAERDKIAGSTKGVRDAKRAIKKSKIPVWEKELNRLRSQIEEINQKLKTGFRGLPYLTARLETQKIFGRKVDLYAFLHIEDFVVASLELIIERNAPKPLADIIKEVDEMIIYLKRNASYPRNVHDAVVLALSRVKRAVYLNPNKINLNYSQRLFREVVGTI